MNKINDAYNKEILAQEKQEILSQINAMDQKLKHGQTAAWAMVAMLLNKIGGLSDEVKYGPAMFEQDILNVQKDAANLQKDIQEMEQDGVNNNTAHLPDISDDLVKKFKNDLLQFKSDIKKLNTDNANLQNPSKLPKKERDAIDALPKSLQTIGKKSLRMQLREVRIYSIRFLIQVMELIPLTIL